MKKKIIPTIFLLLILIANVTFASYSTVTMHVVEEPVCTIKIGENSKFEKKLISKDLKNKEVTLQLQVTNEETSNKPSGEIVLVIDNSASMEEKTSTGVVRKDLVFNSAKTLVSNLLKDNKSLKIGVVSFSTNVDVSKEGTSEDASLVTNLSADATAINTAIDKIVANGPRTNLESGLSLATNQFTTTDNNKYIIVLTDGVPNVALNYDKSYYSDDVIAKTKAKLLQISNSKINLITMLTGIADESYVPGTTTKNFGQIISEIFGTTTNPTAGRFYYISDDKIESTINEIYDSLIPTSASFKDIKVVDYFPAEIINNFDFSYVSKANIGEISATVDKTNNSIIWNIPELAPGKTATVQYKLKLKENFDSSIVDRILNTNKKVDITYKDQNDKEQDKTSDVSPKLKLVEPKASEPPKELPAAGKTSLIALGAFMVVILGYSAIKLLAMRN